MTTLELDSPTPDQLFARNDGKDIGILAVLVLLIGFATFVKAIHKNTSIS